MKKSTKIVAGVGLAGALYLWWNRAKQQASAVRRTQAAAAAKSAEIDDTSGASAGSLAGATLNGNVFRAKHGMGSLG